AGARLAPCSLHCCADYARYLHSFPTRRSSDLCSRCPTWRRWSWPCSPPCRPECRPRPWPPRADAPRGAGGFPLRYAPDFSDSPRSEEHTSELQSRENLVCRLLLEKKKTNF